MRAGILPQSSSFFSLSLSLYIYEYTFCTRECIIPISFVFIYRKNFFVVVFFFLLYKHVNVKTQKTCAQVETPTMNDKQNLGEESTRGIRWMASKVYWTTHTHTHRTRYTMIHGCRQNYIYFFLKKQNKIWKNLFLFLKIKKVPLSLLPNDFCCPL